MQAIWFTIILQPLFNILIFLYKYLGSDMGLAIIALTIIIRLVFWPSQGKALRSQKALSELQPEIEKIREKYKAEPQKQSQEIMALYRNKKISPLSGCLPLIIQFPILIGLYSILSRVFKGNNFDWLYGFISKPEALNTTLFGIVNLASPEKIVMPILAGATQFVLAWLSRPKTQPKPKLKDPKKPAGFDMQGMMGKQMLYFFPILIIFFSFSLPAGLVLYWIVTNVFMIAQQYIINKRGIQPPKVAVSVRKK
jgi:YidC/Oxa1 family membrane protein insertase